MINCKIINLNKKFDKRGKLVIIENNKEVPFKIKRIYYIYEVEKSWIISDSPVTKSNITPDRPSRVKPIVISGVFVHW